MTSESLGFKFFLITEMWHVYFQLEFYITGKQDTHFSYSCVITMSATQESKKLLYSILMCILIVF